MDTIIVAVFMYVMLYFSNKMIDAKYDAQYDFDDEKEDDEKERDIFGDPVPSRDRNVILGLPVFLWLLPILFVVSRLVPPEAYGIVFIAAVCISVIVYLILRDRSNKKALNEMLDDETPDGEEGTSGVTPGLASVEKPATNVVFEEEAVFERIDADGEFEGEAVFEGIDADDVFEEEAVFDINPRIINVPKV